MGFVLVDDMNLIGGKLFDSTEDIEDTARRIQKAIYTWEWLLKTTSGAIRLDKSFIYQITFKFDSKGRYSFKTKLDSDLSFIVKDEYNKLQPLAIIEPSKGKETLGVILVPDGLIIDQFQVLFRKAMYWASSIYIQNLSG